MCILCIYFSTALFGSDSATELLPPARPLILSASVSDSAQGQGTMH